MPVLCLLLLSAQAHAFYNPMEGRWLSRDPIEEAGGANVCGFTGNDPASRWDVLGKIFEGGEWPMPPNRVDPPSGPFSTCRIAVQCGTARFHGIPVGTHCGLVLDVGNGSQYAFNGSGGTSNRRDLTTPPDQTEPIGAFVSMDPSYCECIFSNIKPWNDRKVPRNNECANSNWNLKCALKKCNLEVEWGNQRKPIGFDCSECSKYGFRAMRDRDVRCCVEWRDKPCPDE